MFTGIVEAVGEIVAREPRDGGARLTLSHPGWTDGLDVGASVAVDGCCLTVVDAASGTFSVVATRETLARTRLGALAPGAPVNLERPLRLGDRLGGHWLQGHVDGVLPVASLRREGEVAYLTATVPEEALEWVVPQGSIALNGVSLTVLGVKGPRVRVAVIPHTWAATNLSALRPGHPLNVEYDIVAKYLRPRR